MKFFNQNKAFTLAEVLITLGIIGIVAAMTIPALISNMQDNQYKQAWKKDFAVISSAYSRVKQDEGGDLSSYFTAVNSTWPLIYYLEPYLKVAVSCPTTGDVNSVCGNGADLSTNQYKTLSGGVVKYNNMNQSQFVLNDGTHLFFRRYNAGWLLVFVDVNGFNKGPNTLGKDLFGISITKDWIKPMGATGTGVEGRCNTTTINCSSAYGFSGTDTDCAGAGCAADYLYK